MDELWSFVKARRHKLWTWIALCRRTRQVVAYVCGQRNDRTCTDLRCRIPTGLTNHVEQFNATLRNRLGCFTRKTLSFSKKKENHEAVLHIFLLKYN